MVGSGTSGGTKEGFRTDPSEWKPRGVSACMCALRFVYIQRQQLVRMVPYSFGQCYTCTYVSFCVRTGSINSVRVHSAHSSLSTAFGREYEVHHCCRINSIYFWEAKALLYLLYAYAGRLESVVYASPTLALRLTNWGVVSQSTCSKQTVIYSFITLCGTAVPNLILTR